MNPFSFGAVLIAVAWFGHAGCAQTTWAKHSVPSARAGHGIAFDNARSRVVLFGGTSGFTKQFGRPLLFDDTWEHDGTGWALRTPAMSPSARTKFALTYDSARNKVVLFGGQDNYYEFAETWEYDGNTWLLRTPSASPPARTGHVLVYDSARRKVVMFGGAHRHGLFADTWEYDGISWFLRAPAVSPPARTGHALAYDSIRDKMVLFGGGDYNTGLFADTWEYDGTHWAQRAPATTPPARFGHTLTFDRARHKLVLFGGGGNNGYSDDTWEYDGANWVLRAPTSIPFARTSHALTYDEARDQVVLFAGAGASLFADTWRYDGTTWTLDPGSSPSARLLSAMAHDSARGTTVLFGGLSKFNVGLADTWEFDGTCWALRNSHAAGLVGRGAHALAYDSLRRKFVLFGGFDYASRTHLNDTWEYDGTSWVRQVPMNAPSNRRSHAMAYDCVRNKVVLFGGYVGTGWVADTWEYDGVGWTLRTLPISPSRRFGHAMAYDSLRNRIVLFGGHGGTTAFSLDDTWEYDGTTWARRVTTTTPPGREYHVMAYDRARGRIVLHSGQDSSGSIIYNDTWEYDGTDWALRVPATTPPPQSIPALAYDSTHGKVVLFGGNDSATWQYGPIDPAVYSAYGSGCSGSAGIPLLESEDGSLPWVGDRFRARLSNVGMSPLNVPFLMMGDSRAFWGPYNLPLDLALLGMPGCALHVNPQWSVLLSNNAGTASWAIDVPSSPTLVGASAYVQGAVLDLPTNPLGLVLSNAAEVRFGAR